MRWRKVGGKAAKPGGLGRLFLAGLSAALATFRCLLPTSHGPAAAGAEEPVPAPWQWGQEAELMAAPGGCVPAQEG